MTTDRILDALLLGLSVAAGATAVWVIWTTPVLSDVPPHDPADSGHWYPMECCNLRDCFEVSPDQLVPTADGWRYTPTGEVIPYDKARQTPPEAGNSFHVCTYGGNPLNSIIGTTRPEACVWTPQLGS